MPHHSRKTAVVIPTARQIVADRIAAIPEGVDIFVVNDSEHVVEPCRDRMTVFSREQQQEVMGADADLIPRGTAACRNFGFYYIWKHTDHDVVVTIDDDVVCADGFMTPYSSLGSRGEWANVSVDAGWFNTIGLTGALGADGAALYPRGFPFWLRAPHPYVEEQRVAPGRLVGLMGLWSNCLDYDGIDKFLFEDYRTHQSRVAVDQILTVGGPGRHTKFPLCAMNCGFIRELLPAAYQFPMDRCITTRYPIWRFDDIWSGYIMQSLVHRRADSDCFGVGPPVVTHLKDGDMRREILGEHAGHLMSPYFYGLIDLGVANIRRGSYAEMLLELFTQLSGDATHFFDEVGCPALYRTYFADTFARIHRWAALCCNR